MINLILPLIMLFCSPQQKYWEQMTNIEKEQILNSKELSSNIKSFYEKGRDKYKFDTSETYDIYWKTMDTLVSLNADNKLLPLYFHIFNIEFSIADGEIAEPMGEYCIRMVLKDPNYVIGYLKGDLLYEYGGEIGFTLSFAHNYSDEIQYNEFKRILYDKVKKEYVSTLDKLFVEIDKTMKIMED